MSTGLHAVGDALHRQLFGDKQYMQHDRVARDMRGVDELELGGMAEHRFGDERPPQLDQFRPSLRGD
jgi:hypothetical protein